MKTTFFILTHFISFLTWANNCPQNAYEYNNKTLPSLDKELRINITRACMSGEARVDIYCSSYSSSDEQCIIGKIMVCRFCKSERQGLCDYSYLEVNNSVGLTAFDCIQLEGLDVKKSRMNVNLRSFCTAGGIRDQLIKNSESMVVHLKALSTLSLQKLRTLKENINLMNRINDIESNLVGERGLFPILNLLTEDDLVLDIKKTASHAQSQWQSIQQTINHSSETLLSEKESRRLRAFLKTTLTLYKKINRQVDRKLGFKENSEVDAVMCDSL